VFHGALLIGKGGGSYACLLPSLYGPQINWLRYKGDC
jgi:hypothetical protein